MDQVERIISRHGKLSATIPEARETGRPVDDMSTAFHFLHMLNVDTTGYTTATSSSVPADFYQ
ncbi:hypothetical protein SYNPS1DRAFT_26107 [Syncephalis pseudoplumigaleata]|uniref:Uncharacterized protein n=1 Tax=Syncephalis pseudoplumigaleata TaxID=1712513 RepID=A0A4P9YR78_9FUNG|nr:hypothetical protein SYNPS1DRAFT_26107 [Syncephalis pseudoplumigaleata]|eukprot:RKP22234.1 hypothetical protein SYNPS1DRAFT_26107 [Syncephalis pseudoplumigaleata]